ncbi:MAG: DUF6497 family protein [Celeribacter marinus]
MRSIAILLSVFAFVPLANAEQSSLDETTIAVPSGQTVSFYESLMDHPEQDVMARFRFLAPELPTRLADMSYQDLEADLAYLCASFALPRLAATDFEMIVISVAQAPTEFGIPNPDVVEVFEMYSRDGSTCTWEAF